MYQSGNRSPRAVAGAVSALALALALAGCASGSSGGGSATDATPLTYRDTATGECAASPKDGVDLAAAEAYVDAFRVPADRIYPTEPLPEALPEDMLVVFANNDTIVAEAYYKPWAEEASETAGVQFQNVSVGTSAESQQAGFNSIIALDPDIVIMGAIDPTFVQDQLQQLEAAGATIVSVADPKAEDFGLYDAPNGYGSSIVNGNLLAAGAIYFTCGTADDFVFYNIPELSFSAVQLEAAQEYITELNPDAQLRVVDISIADPAPADKIVSDLQAHPETAFFVTPADQFQVGLSAAAALAGVENAFGFGQSSLPQNYEQVAAGEQAAAFGLDYQAFMYLVLDQGFRQYFDVFTPYTVADWEVVNPLLSSVITMENVEDYPGGAFVAYPNTVTAYAELWGK